MTDADSGEEDESKAEPKPNCGEENETKDASKPESEAASEAEPEAESKAESGDESENESEEEGGDEAPPELPVLQFNQEAMQPGMDQILSLPSFMKKMSMVGSSKSICRERHSQKYLRATRLRLPDGVMKIFQRQIE